MNYTFDFVNLLSIEFLISLSQANAISDIFDEKEENGYYSHPFSIFLLSLRL